MAGVSGGFRVRIPGMRCRPVPRLNPIVSSGAPSLLSFLVVPIHRQRLNLTRSMVNSISMFASVPYSEAIRLPRIERGEVEFCGPCAFQPSWDGSSSRRTFRCLASVRANVVGPVITSEATSSLR